MLLVNDSCVLIAGESSVELYDFILEKTLKKIEEIY